MIKHIVLIGCFLISHAAYPLSCALKPVKKQIENAESIFVGQVVKIVSSQKIINDNPWDANLKVVAKLKVLKPIRGKFNSTQLVNFSFKVKAGQKYLIFNKSAFSSICDISLSRKLSESGKLLKMLNVK